MLTARSELDNLKYLSVQTPNYLKREKWICLDCKQPVLYVDSKFKLKHFRHCVKSNCNPEPETEAHLIMKLFMMEILHLEKSNVEVPLGFAKPDLFYEQHGKKIAIEVQHSKISYENFITRTQNYSDNDIYVLWIFHSRLLNCEYISEVIKKAHELYFGRVYIFDNEFSESIIPTHLNKVERWVEEFNGVGGYYKTLKKKRGKFEGNKITHDADEPEILKLNLNQFKGGNFKIAMFDDPVFWKDNRNGSSKIYSRY